MKTKSGGAAQAIAAAGAVASLTNKVRIATNDALFTAPVQA